MSKRKIPPSSARILSKWVDAYARVHGLPQKRIRDWISFMALGGHLVKENTGTKWPPFTLKGAVALEMRLPCKARATRDLDLIVEDAVQEVRTFIAEVDAAGKTIAKSAAD